MVIDFHTHFYPETYLEDLAREPGAARVSRDETGRWVVHYAGDYNIVADGHISVEARLRDMDAAGMDLAVLSFTTPGVHVEAPARGIRLARLVNDAYAALVRAHPDRFSALATLPLQAPEAAADELERAVIRLGLPGAMVFSNVNGRPLDSPEFRPVFERAARLGVPLMVHPTTPIFGTTGVNDYRLVAILGFLFDTTIAACRLVFSGLFEAYPRLQLVLAHLGGTLPYVAERADRAWAVYPELRPLISQPPTALFKNFYYDTVNFDLAALELALKFAGPDRLLLGSDYPHQVGDMTRAVETVSGLAAAEEVRRAILGDNAARLLRLKG
jgi:aminocarboxymuconate-semialdehyde decarboxylase